MHLSRRTPDCGEGLRDNQDGKIMELSTIVNGVESWIEETQNIKGLNEIESW